MLERQVSDLQTKSNQYRLELNDLAAQISELKILVAECSKKCELISRFDEFMANQKKTNQTFATDMKTGFDFMSRANSQADKANIEADILKQRVDIHQDLLSKMMTSVYECHQKFDDQELPNQFVKFKQEFSSYKAAVDLEFKHIDDEMCVPFADVINSYAETHTTSKKAAADSEKAKEIAERLGVEHKVLNRKLNDILEKLK